MAHRVRSSQTRAPLADLKDKRRNGGVSATLVEDILEAVNIVDLLEQEYDVVLNDGSNGWLTCCCPLPNHRDDSPSFGVNIETNRFNCFGCNVKGDAISFVRKMEGLSFPEAVAKLASLTGVTDGGQANEMYRAVRDIDRAITEFLGRQSDTDLPAGMSAPQFFRSLADRLYDFECKVDGDDAETEWVDGVYLRADDLRVEDDQKGLCKLWNSLGVQMRARLIAWRASQEATDEVA